MIRHSCAYAGTVVHRRHEPLGHAFRYRVFMLYLDLDEVDELFAARLLWSATRPALVRWRREDHAGDSAVPLDEWVRGLVTERTGRRPQGPVRLLTHPRYLGAVFNPISVYYCFASDGATLETAVLEVTNTPWLERTHYVLDMRGPGRARTGRMRKAMHVSPFLPMDLEYRWRLTTPDDTVSVAVDVHQGDRVVLETAVGLRRHELTATGSARLLATHRPMPLQVVGGIYWQAFRLWRKGADYHPRRARAADTDLAA